MVTIECNLSEYLLDGLEADTKIITKQTNQMRRKDNEDLYLLAEHDIPGGQQSIFHENQFSVLETINLRDNVNIMCNCHGTVSESISNKRVLLSRERFVLLL